MPTKIKGLTGVDKVEAGAVITNPSFSGNATVTGSLTVGGVNVFSGPYRNLIINGDMQIAQRGTSVSGITTSGYNTVDRWTSRINNTGTWTETQDTSVPSGQGFSNSFKLQCTTANASLSATSSMTLQYRFEGQHLQHLKKGTSNAESVTLSFWVKSNKTGTYVANLYDLDNTRTISKSYTIDTADTWEKKTLTYEGDTTGTLDNNNARSMDINMWLAAGSDYTSGTLGTSWHNPTLADRAVGQVNLADSTSNYINITGIQLEVGEGASDFEFLPYDVQLARCQRYFFQPPSAYTDVTGFNYASGAYSAVFFPTTMRATPSITNLGGTTWYQGGSAYTFTYINASSTTAHTRLHGSVSGGLNGGAGTFYPYFSADAEL